MNQAEFDNEIIGLKDIIVESVQKHQYTVEEAAVNIFHWFAKAKGFRSSVEVLEAPNSYFIYVYLYEHGVEHKFLTTMRKKDFN